MSLIKDANKILQNVSYPIKAAFVFRELKGSENLGVEPYLVQEVDEAPLKIVLNFPFYISIGENAALVSDEESFNKLGLNGKIRIVSISINKFSMMEIISDEYSIIALPGLYFGWGVYKNGKEIIHYHGWDEGIELGE